LTVKSRDDDREWPGKHRHWMFEVAKDEAHNIWVRAHDLRVFWEKFAANRELKVTHSGALLYVRDSKSLYVSHRAMRLVQAKNFAIAGRRLLAPRLQAALAGRRHAGVGFDLHELAERFLIQIHQVHVDIQVGLRLQRHGGGPGRLDRCQGRSLFPHG
jgi:hypothetical protein